MNLSKYLINSKSQFTTGIDVIDQNIDIGKPSLISLCGDNDMVTTSILHLMTERSVCNGRPAFYVNAAHAFEAELYGIREDALERITRFESNSCSDLAILCEEVPENALVLYDNLAAAYGAEKPEEYMREFFATGEVMKRNKRVTFVFAEYFQGHNDEPLSTSCKRLDFRINIRTIQRDVRSETHEMTIFSGGGPRQICTERFVIPRNHAYHRYFADIARSKTC